MDKKEENTSERSVLSSLQKEIKPNQVRARKNRNKVWSFYVVVYDLKLKKYSGMFFRHDPGEDMIYNGDFSPQVKDPVILDNINEIGTTIGKKFEELGIK